MTERRILIDPPIDGYKTEAVYKIPSQGDYYLSSDHKVNVLRSREDDLLHPNELKIILTPDFKLLDWDKVSGNALIKPQNGTGDEFAKALNEHALKFLINPNNKELSDIWQAYTGSGECPVDPDACIVDVKYWNNLELFSVPANEQGWIKVAQWRFVRLAKGYKYP